MLAQQDHSAHAAMPVVADSTKLDRQVAEVRLAVARFANDAEALAAGYRRPASSTPTMGEHWTNPALVRDGKLDRSRPEVLMYASTGGERRLVGVAYLIPSRVAGPAPSLFDGDTGHWHTHGPDDPLVAALAGGGDGGAAPRGAAMGGRQGARRGRGRMAGAPRQRAGSAVGVTMLHIWLVEASDGVFTDHNHLLPFLSAGLPFPPTIPPAGATAREHLAKAGLAIAERAGHGSVTRVADRLLPTDALQELVRARTSIAALESAYADAVARNDAGAIEQALSALSERFDAIRRTHADLPDRPRAVLDEAYANMLGRGHGRHH